MREHLFNRTDRVAFLAPWGKPIPVELERVTPVSRPDSNPLDALLLAHVVGLRAPVVKVKYLSPKGAEMFYSNEGERPWRIGTYAPAEDNTTRWICLDFDGGKDHADALVDPAGVAVATLTRMHACGLVAYLERSGGGAGYHVWVLFSQPEPAEAARELGLHFAPRDALLVGGGGTEHADPRAGRGIEVFPKQVAHRGRKKTGNMIWAPWWAGAAEGGNRFYEHADAAAKPATSTPSPTAPSSPEVTQ